MKKKMTVLVAAFACGFCAFADITVSDVQVFSGHPWKEVVVGYTITGADERADFIRLTATDNSEKKTYTAQTLKNAELTEGRHVLRWEAAVEGVKFSSTNVVFAVSIVSYGGVQLWENGPYWAECNVGATKPEEYGYYFWWGDTVGYKRNAGDDGWISVKDGSRFLFIPGKCLTYGMDDSQLRSDGYIDATGNLVAAHDAATAHLGAPWRMPTDAEFAALTNNCDTAFMERNGVNGLLVTGRGAYASKSIFLPAPGYGVDYLLYAPGSHGDYWSSTPDSSSRYYAWYFYFTPGSVGRNNLTRDVGRSIRPLRESTK